MSTLDSNFNDKAEQKAASERRGSKYPPPYSMRFTAEERELLDAARGRKPLSAYIRERLFGSNAAPRKREVSSPIKDSEAFGRALGALGKSRLSSNLNQLAKFVNSGMRDPYNIHKQLEEVKTLLQFLKSNISGNDR